MVVRTNENAGIAGIEETKPTNDDQIVTVNEDTTRTEYPRAGTSIAYRVFRYFSKGVTCRVATAASVGSQDRAGTWSRTTPQGTLSYVATGVGRAEEAAEGAYRKGLYSALSFTVWGASPLCP